MFDIWYNNTSVIKPVILTGDMHSANKANFAILSWFGADYRPRFTNLKRELNNVYGTKEVSRYKKFLVKPAGQLEEKIILNEKNNLDGVVATLALKETKQSTLIKKLCALPSSNKTRKAVFEYNNLKRSIYTLKCLLDPQILADSHRSQNRLESYHTLRSTIAKAGGRKALLGRTDLEMEISNQCGVLIALAILYFNNLIYSRIFDKNPSKKIIKALKKASPAAWKHVHFGGHFTFYDHQKKIDLDEILTKIKL
jgi:TnpA family transposase